MFILSSISIGLEFWPVNHTPIWKNSESNTFKKVKFLDEVSNNRSNNFLEKMYKKPWISLLIIIYSVTMY